LALGSGFWWYVGCLLGAALGITLTSGSDTALLHAFSKNFKKDQTETKFYTATALFVATTLGALLAIIDIRLPFLCTGILSIIGGALIFTIRGRSPKSGQSNIFETAFASLRHIRQKPIILHFIGLAAASYGFVLGIKWFYNPLLEQMHIPLGYWGIIMGTSLVAPLIGIKLYQKRPLLHSWTVFVLFCLSIVPIGLVQIAAVSIAALYILMLLQGYLETALDIELNQTIQTAQRASILSLVSLSSRLSAAVYIPLAGGLLAGTNFIVLTSVTAGVLLLICGLSVIRLAIGRSVAS
jgi:hypothetical protein